MSKDHQLVLRNGDGSQPGQHFLSFCKLSEEEVALVSCGADKQVSLRAARTGRVKASTASEGTLSNGPCNVLAYHPSGFVAVGGEHKVKLVTLPSMEVERKVCSSKLPVRALSFNPVGSMFAMGGDAENIQLVQLKDGKVVRQLLCEGYVRSAAWDPEGTYVAATMANGLMCVYDTNTGKLQTRKAAARKVDVASGARCSVDWHPDGGALLAVAGSADGDVTLYERLSWEASSYLGGGHRGPANVVAFSPNGLYAATGGEDACVCIWDVTKATIVCKAVSGPASEKDENSVSPGSGSAISSLAWHPTGNSIAVVDETGRVGVWENAVPSRLPSPSCDLEQMRQEGTKTGKGRKVPRAGGASLVDDEAGDDSEEGDSEGGTKATDGFGDDFGDGDTKHTGGGDEVGSGGVQGAGEGVGVAAAEIARMEAELKRAMRMLRSYTSTAPPPPQGPIQPCSTPKEATTNSGARFLAYTMEGCIITRPVDDHNVVELQFHDAGRANAMGLGRVPLLTDFYGFTVGALGAKGALYGSPQSKDSPSMLVYRPFEEWAPNGAWSVGLPPGESVQCVAAGASFAAAATSSQLLRVFSVSGLQTAIMSLPGAPAALAAQEHMLAVVMHGGPPSGTSQCLEVALYDMPSSTCLLSGPCPLSPKASLTWLGFTDDGLLATADTAGIIRVRSHTMGGAWMPVFNEAAASKAGEVFWPVAIRNHELCSIMCPKQQPYPSVHPRPFFTRLPLQVPVVAVEGGVPALEAELLLTSLRLESARLRAEVATGIEAVYASEELVSRQTEADRSLLKIFQAALKNDRQARAMDVVHQLSLHRSLEGALKLANYHRASAVAERVALVLQQVEAPTAEHQDITVTPLPQKFAPGTRAPGPLAEHDTNAGEAPNSNPPSTSGQGQLTALKQMASAATPGGPASQGENKRKPSGGPSLPSNPFARRPTKAAKH